jgi:transcriptional regulator
MDYYKEPDKEKILSFMKEHSFATVTGFDGQFPVASHLPLEITMEGENLYFSGHMMRKTDHQLAFEKNENVLVIFQSPHAYVSAGWYENPAQGSTVNYMAVHAKGIISFMDEAGTLEELRKLTDKHIGLNSPASFQNISDEYKASMVKAIRGFKITVTDLQHVFKLSQNRNKSDQEKIMEQLEKRHEYGSDFIAQQMKERI